MLTEEELAHFEDDAAKAETQWCPVRSEHYRALVAEVRELRLLLRESVKDDVPGNRLWREGVKAGLEAAADTAQKIGDGLKINSGIEGAAGAWATEVAIRRIDPFTILPSP